MTVPLLRRHGYTMQESVSAANPLSLPVALCGSVTYAISGWQQIPMSGFFGFYQFEESCTSGRRWLAQHLVYTALPARSS